LSQDSGPSTVAELSARIGATLARVHQARNVTVGCSARRAVWSHGRTTLFQYAPAPGARQAGHRVRPLLISFALVNRPYVLDLQPARSLIRRLLEAGASIYLIDWGEPEEGGHTELSDYVIDHLGGCVDYLRMSQDVPAVDLLGVCQGGVLSLCYSALFPERIANLVTITTPVDFQTPQDLLAKWVRGLDTELIAQLGNMPGALLNGLFLALMPLRLAQQKYVRLLTGQLEQDAIDDFVRMEKWIFDSPPQAGTALAQYVRWFYQENRFIGGTLELAGRPVRLAAIRQPVLNLYALEDHIVPAAASAALGRYVGSRDYSAQGFATGHVGMYVSRTAQESIPRRISSWLAERARPSRRSPRSPGR
jgi:polyhydroxyalkanoate synthase subunit PhaC